MKPFQTEFLRFVIENQILRFGEFTLKSGRVSPYFFNAGLFNSGRKLAFLGRSYAAAIVDADHHCDVLFGPAYKGIPLVAATALALASDHAVDKPFCFNRKEAKVHGEGGSIVGAALSGDVLLVDDVITAGTAVREAEALISHAGAQLGGILVAMDRQERGQGSLSAIQELEQQFAVPVINIIGLSHIIQFLDENAESELHGFLDDVKRYRDRYGV